MRRTFLLALGAVIAVVGMVVVPASADAVRTRTESAQAKAAPSLKVTVRGLPRAPRQR